MQRYCFLKETEDSLTKFIFLHFYLDAKPTSNFHFFIYFIAYQAVHVSIVTYDTYLWKMSLLSAFDIRCGSVKKKIRRKKCVK